MCVSGYDFHRILSHQDGTLVLIWGQTKKAEGTAELSGRLTDKRKCVTV